MELYSKFSQNLWTYLVYLRTYLVKINPEIKNYACGCFKTVFLYEIRNLKCIKLALEKPGVTSINCEKIQTCIKQLRNILNTRLIPYRSILVLNGYGSFYIRKYQIKKKSNLLAGRKIHTPQRKTSRRKVQRHNSLM